MKQLWILSVTILIVFMLILYMLTGMNFIPEFGKYLPQHQSNGTTEANFELFNFRRTPFSKLEYNRTQLVKKKDLLPDPQHEFKPYTGDGVFTYRYVCFEAMGEYSAIAVDMSHVSLQKKIIVFNATEDKKVNLKVVGSSNEEKFWPIEFRKRQIPSGFVTLPYPAYFVTASQPGNLYHLLHDTLRDLLKTLKKTNRLNSTVKNQVYTRKPHIPFYQARSKNITTYGELIDALAVRSYPVFHAAPNRVCHEYGVFGHVRGTMQEMIKYFLKYFNIDEKKLCKEKAYTLTFVERGSYRKVTNREELLKAAESLGLKVRNVKLETLSPIEQMKIIRCTDILVGVQGAGLRWSEFLQRKRALVELTFPGWPSFFLKDHKRQGGLGRELVGKKDGAQWKFLQEENHGQPVTNIGPKLHDSKYNVSQFVKILREITKELSTALSPSPQTTPRSQLKIKSRNSTD